MATSYNPFAPAPTPGVSYPASSGVNATMPGQTQFPSTLPNYNPITPTDLSVHQAGSPFDYAAGVFTGAAQPSIAANQLDINANQRNIAYAIQNQGISADLLRAQAAESGGNTAAGLASNAINLEAAKRQIPLISALTGIEKSALERQPQLLMTLLNSDVVKMGIQREQAKTGAANDVYNLNMKATEMGSYASTGARHQRHTIADQLSQSLGLIDQNEVQARAQARESYAQILDKLGTLDLTSTEQLAGARDKIALLEIEGQRLGTSAGAVASQLQAGLAKLGLQTTMNVDDLLDGVAKGKLQETTIYNNALLAAGQWAQAYEATR